jgi:hypothetical protein
MRERERYRALYREGKERVEREREKKGNERDRKREGDG